MIIERMNLLRIKRPAIELLAIGAVLSATASCDRANSDVETSAGAQGHDNQRR